MTAASLLTDGDAELSEFAKFYRPYVLEGQDMPYFFVKGPAGVFSRYPSGMMSFALPVVAAARLLHADLAAPIVDQHLEQLTAALVATACTTLFFLLAWQLASPATALIATIMLGTGSVMYSTIGQALWQHGGVILWTEILLLIEFRTWRQGSWRATAAQGLALSMMFACRLSAAVFVLSFGVWVLLRSPSRAVKIAGFAAIASLPWLVFHWSLYHSLIGPSAWQTNGIFWSFGKPHTWAAILFSPTHGLLIYQPWLLLAVAALWPDCKRFWSAARADAADHTPRAKGDAMRSPPGWRLWATSAVALHLTVLSGWFCWWGGSCWGSRLASEAVPLAALLGLGPLELLLQSRTGRCVACATVVLSTLLHVPSVWLHQNRWYDGMDSAAQEANAWHWNSPPFLYPFTGGPSIQK